MQSKWQSLLQTFWKFFLEPSSVLPLVFLRISFAVLALALWIALYPSVELLFGKEGYIEWFISDTFFSDPALPTLYKTLKLLNQFASVTPHQFIHALYFVYGSCLVMIGIGFYSNAFAFTAWLLHLVIFNTSVIYAYGVETFIHLLLFYFIFMPIDARWSVSSLLFKRYWARRKAGSQVRARIFLRVLQIHLCIIYLDAGLSKIFGTHWWNGEALWRSLTQFPFNPFNLLFIHKFLVVLQVFGWLILLMETFYVLFIWNSTTRRFLLPGIILMHTGIAFLMGLYFFGLIMIIMNLSAFAFNNRVKHEN